jgi:hypothetical protein
VLCPSRGEILALLDQAMFGLSDGELLDSIRAVEQVKAAADSVYLSLLATLQSRPEAVPGAAPGGAAVTFLAEGLRASRGRAARDVRASVAVASGTGSMPALAAAFAGGEITREHVDVAVAAVNKLPAAVKRLTSEDGTTGLQVLDGLVTEQAKTGQPGTVDRLGKDLLMVMDPDRACRLDEDAVQRRGGSHMVDYSGMHLFRFALDPATGAQVMPIFAAYAKPAPAGPGEGEDGQEVLFPDRRSHSQRMADAFAGIVRDAAAGGMLGHDEPASAGETPDFDGAADVGGVDGEAAAPAGRGRCAGCGGRGGAFWRVTPELVVVTTPDQLAAAQGVLDVAAKAAGLAQVSLAGGGGDWPGSSLDPTTLGRLSCDAVLRRVLAAPNGAVMNLGRARRLASPGQRKALFARDGGCVIAGCGIPSEWCDVHHVIPWSEGGSTDTDSMCLLCPRHHTAVHAQIWRIQLREGIPWVRPPSWVDIRRRWFRNTTHEHRGRARRAAQNLTRQLRLPLEPPSAA